MDGQVKKGVKLISLVKKKGNMTQEEFRMHWLEEHAKITLELKHVKGYRINIPIEYQKNKELPYDGIAEIWWDSVEEMKEDLESEIGLKSKKDTSTFMENFHIYTEEIIFR